MSKTNYDSLELQINNFITQFMKANHGRGPRETKIKIVDNVLVYFIKGIFSPMEMKILQSEDGEKAVLESRRIYVKEASKDRIPGLEKLLGLKAIEHYETWDIKRDSAVSVVVFEKNIL